MKTQIVKCNCNEIIAGCISPYYLYEPSWLKAVEQYKKNGCVVSVVDQHEFAFGSCKCVDILLNKISEE